MDLLKASRASKSVWLLLVYEGVVVEKRMKRNIIMKGVVEMEGSAMVLLVILKRVEQ